MSHRTTVTLFHATPVRNTVSILNGGLLPALARGALKEVWLGTKGLRAWAVQHVALRHGVPEGAVAVFRVRVPRSALTRRKRGVYSSRFTVRPDQIVSVNLFAESSELAAAR